MAIAPIQLTTALVKDLMDLLEAHYGEQLQLRPAMQKAAKVGTRAAQLLESAALIDADNLATDATFAAKMTELGLGSVTQAYLAGIVVNMLKGVDKFEEHVDALAADASYRDAIYESQLATIGIVTAPEPAPDPGS